MGEAIKSLLEEQPISAVDQQSTSSSVLEMLTSLFTTDLLESETSSLSVGKAIEILSDEKNKLEKIEEARRRAELIAQKQREEQEALEREAHRKEIEQVTSMDLPLDWENLFHGDQRAENIHAESSADALLLSLSNLGRVDIEYMAEISGSDPKSVIIDLKGSIFQNPETWERCWYKGWETKDHYLSGNLIKKRKAAIEANKEFNGYFRENISAIDAALPTPIPPEDIYVTLGSPWIPPDVIDDFANHIIGLDHHPAIDGTKHDPITGTWELPYRGRSAAGIERKLTTKGVKEIFHSSHNSFGTERLAALDILEKTLNMRPVKVTDPDPAAPSSSKKRILNEGETLSALEQQKKMIAEFKTWVWSDPARSERLQISYENNFGCVKQRKFNGFFLEFPNMSPNVTLRQYQKDAVARMIMMPNTLLAHDVGAGKTYMMIAAGVEMKRMGLSKKNLYVVPNGILAQWSKMFEHIYPNSNVLTVHPKDFTPAKRNKTLRKMRDDDFDAILIAYSSFTSIKLSHEEEFKSLEEELENATRLINSADANCTKNLVNHRAELKKKLDIIKSLIASTKNMLDEEVITFDDLGITRLFVDEAHNFKNVPIETKMKDYLGISSKGSARCRDMMDKVRCVQRQNAGAGVIFATGTPITNSITDAFIMQKYLQNGELAMIDLQSFDDWVRMFAEPSTEFEIDVDTSSFRMATRLSKFHNLPELTTLLSSIADFHPLEGSDSLPKIIDREDVIVKRSPDFEDYLQLISYRTDQIRSRSIPRTMDNMLVVTTDGRKAALDMRLVAPQTAFTLDTKAMACAEKVADIYFSTMSEASTQLIFCDISTPKSSFNLYDEIKSCLGKLGVPASQIAFVHDYESASDRARLFQSMNAGTIRVLIGSTFKIGIGVNIQDKLVALHHLDVPWRPADMEQREGRMIRPGNENDHVGVYRYITEGSFDAYSWQLLETKQKFITALLSGSVEQRSMGEIDSTVLDYAEVKAIAIGDERIKERVEAVNELSRLRMLQKEQAKMREVYSIELQSIPVRKEKLLKHLSSCKVDMENYAAWKRVHSDQDVASLSSSEKKARLLYLSNLRQAVHDQLFSSKERVLPDYRGFSIVVPANVSLNDAFVYVIGNARYRVQLGTSSRGYLVRIDNFLDGLGLHHEKTVEEVEKLNARKAEIRTKLNEAEDYGPSIEELRLKVITLDKELGIESA